MGKYRIVKLHSFSPLHIGRGLGDAYDIADKTLHSDTLSGAMASVYCLLNTNPDVPAFMNRYKLSSAFPFVNNHFFLPKPLVRMNVEFGNVDLYTQKKKLKKIEFIEYSLWQRLICGEKIVAMKEWLSADGRFLFDGIAIEQSPYIDHLQQRVFVPRNGGDSVPYFLERRYFSSDAGLYFLLDVDPDFEPQLEQILDTLGSIGLGTDKSVGNGQFQYEFGALEIDLPAASDHVVLLSLTCPDKQEISGEILQKSAYQLSSRGGFIAGTSKNQFRHLRKRSLHMFIEGSVLAVSDIKGLIRDVTPTWNDQELHPVYRDGRAFALPVNM